MPKKLSEKRQRGSLVCSRDSGRQCFSFGQGFGVSSMFWTSVVQVHVEQMNKKVDLTRLKLPTVRVGLIFY